MSTEVSYDRFCIYIPSSKYRQIKVKDIVVIDDILNLKHYTNFQSAFKTLYNYHANDLFGVVTNIVKRDDADYYIEGNLLNFRATKNELTFASAAFAFGAPYTAERALKYTERPSSAFCILSPKKAKIIRENYIHWFV